MTKNLFLALSCLCGALLNSAAHAQAIEYRSAKAATVLYDTPSTQGAKRYILLSGTPVEVISTSGEWVKVRDQAGALTWAPASALSPQRTVIVKVDRTTVRQQANPSSPPVFDALRNVVLQLRGQATPTGWVQVSHPDGSTGFIRITDVWGL